MYWLSVGQRLGIAAALLTLSAYSQQRDSIYKFAFGTKAPAGYTLVSPNDLYSDERGYGFEPGSAIHEVTRGGNSGFVTADQPFFFSLAVPEGNYRVTATLGDRDGGSITTIKAELRRLMIEKVQTEAGKIVHAQFVVNVRQPQFGDGNKVKLKQPRETTAEMWSWDNKLTLAFSNKQPKLRELSIEKVSVPTIYIAGDSTSTDQSAEPYNSWGQMITAFFKPQVAIANNGESGESARSFLGENRWAKVMSMTRPGDWILIQFGHNDQKDTRDGAGAFTTYKATLRRFVSEAREHGATPVLITPMNRRTFDADAKLTNSLGDFPEAVRQLAREENVPLIDLNAMSKTLYEALGPEESAKLFANSDTTHHSDYGSYELAKCVVLGIQRDQLAIAKFLKSDRPGFDPAHPDPFDRFDIPPDPKFTTNKPFGQ